METPPNADWESAIASLMAQLRLGRQSKGAAKGKGKRRGPFYRLLPVWANHVKHNRYVLARAHESMLACPALNGKVPQSFAIMRTGSDFELDW
jgi:hypothetical protein